MCSKKCSNRRWPDDVATLVKRVQFMSGLIKRGKGTFHFRMRVPKEYVGVAGKTEIHRTLKTDSARQVAELVPTMRKGILDELEALKLLHDQPNSADAYRAAQNIVKKRGLNYLPSASLLLAPLEETLVRFEKLAEGDDAGAARALLGGVEEPGLRLSELVAAVEEYSAHDNRHKNDDQLRKWRNPRKKAVRNLIKSIGNKDILVSEIDATAVQKHKIYWQKKVTADDTKPETANKDFILMRSILLGHSITNLTTIIGELSSVRSQDQGGGISHSKIPVRCRD